MKKHYPKRIDGTKNVFHKFWSNLGETTKQLAEMIATVDDVLDTIEECKATASESKNNIPPVSSLTECITELNKWYANANKIGKLADEWNTLGKLADNERIAWEKIKDKAAKDLSKKFSKKSIIKGIVIGLVAVAGIALICTGVGAISLTVLGPVGAVLCAGCSEFAFGAIFMFGAFLYGWSVSMAIYEAYKKFECSKQGLKAAKQSIKHVEQISMVMEHIAANSRVIEDAIRKLNAEHAISMGHTTRKLTNNLNKINKINESGTKDISYNVKLERMFNSIKLIEMSMTPFKEACQQCLTKTSAARKSIVDASISNCARHVKNDQTKRQKKSLFSLQ